MGKEGNKRKAVQNKEGCTKYMQVIREGEVEKLQWIKEKEDKTYEISKIIQELKSDDGKIQYKC